MQDFRTYNDNQDVIIIKIEIKSRNLNYSLTVMQQQPQISIIIPIHNAGQYLRPCIDSVILQTYTNLQIILICDCPTDGSDAVAQEYAKHDNRITLINNSTNV